MVVIAISKTQLVHFVNLQDLNNIIIYKLVRETKGDSQNQLLPTVQVSTAAVHSLSLLATIAKNNRVKDD